ncbi:MAG: helix-turn-helix domain-containing protein [Nitrospirota bacterium]
MRFGQRIRKLRMEGGISQQELAKRLGYKTNSYISDVERGNFIPSEGKLKEIAKALGVSFSKIKDFLLESKLEEMGIKEPAFISMFKDYPHLTREDKRAIVNAYLKIKKKTKKK